MSKRKAKPVSAFPSESARYVEAARLVYTKGITLVEAINEVGVCKSEYIELARQVAWPINEKWSEFFTRQSRVQKLLLMAAMAS